MQEYWSDNGGPVMADITMESIIEKLGFDPLRHDYFVGVEGEDDNWVSPFKGLSREEVKFIYDAALADPMCYAKNQHKN